MGGLRTPYSTDLSDPEWEILCPLVPAVKPGGRPAKRTRREILNALAYWLRAGCAWRLLLHDLPPWRTVYHYWRRRQQEGVWQRMLTVLREREREPVDRQARSCSRTRSRSFGHLRYPRRVAPADVLSRGNFRLPARTS
ncbi:transposase [Streptomyces sp. NPDC021080]|uniref:transposase n=1 Tax=Streptomyces sp. NPDC021080 TaxID=3365110 RepID=UPI0037A1F305